MQFSSCMERGFTALEFLTATAIGAVLVALAIPGFGRLRSSASITSAANQMLWSLHLARSSAILRNIPTALCLSIDGTRCLTTAGSTAGAWIVFHDRTRNLPIQLDAGDEILKRSELPRDIEITGSRSAVMYWPSPRAGTTSTFKICGARDHAPGRSVIVSQNGRPRVAGDIACAR